MESFEKLKEAKQLFDQGIINEEEYQTLKDRLLNAIDMEHASNTAQDNVPSAAPTGSVSGAPNGSYNASYTAAGTAPDTEGATFGMKLLSFLIPLVGLILFIVDKDKKPAAAKDELMWAGIGFGIGVVLYIIMVASAASYY